MEKFELTDASFERLWNQNEKRLKNHAKCLTHNHDSADDLLQDTAIKIYMNMDKMTDEKKFCNWGMRIMKNIFLDKKRYDSRRPVTTSFDDLNMQAGCEVDFEDINVDIESDVTLAIVKEMNSRQLRGLISTLSSEYCATISLNTYGNANPLDMANFSSPLDYNSIAELQNTGVNNVRSRIHRAKKSLLSAARTSDYTLK